MSILEQPKPKDTRPRKVYEFKAYLSSEQATNFERVAIALEDIYNAANRIEDTECLIGRIRSKRGNKDYSDRPSKGYLKKTHRLYHFRLKDSGDINPEYKTQAIKTLHEAWHRKETGFYAKLRKFARGEIQEFPSKPRYKNRDKGKVIRTITMGNARSSSAFKVERINNGHNAFVQMPDIGKFKVKGLFKRFPGEFDHGKVSLTQEKDGQFYVQFTMPIDVVSVERRTARQIGVDPGVKAVVATSDGHLVKPNQELTKRQRQRIKRLQRKMDRQQTGSKGYQKTRLAKARLEVKERRSRKAFNAKLADWLGRFDVAFEGTRIQNMTRKAKPKPNEAGTGYERNGAKAKSGLNRVLLQRGIGQIRQLTKVRCESRDRQFIKTADKDVRYSSQRCHCCDQRGYRPKRVQNLFICQNEVCQLFGERQHADINAAKNHLKAGFGLSNESYPGATSGNADTEASASVGEVMRVESGATLAGQPGTQPKPSSAGEASGTTLEPSAGKTVQGSGSVKAPGTTFSSKPKSNKRSGDSGTQKVLDPARATDTAASNPPAKRKRRTRRRVLAKSPDSPRQLSLWDAAG